MMGLMKDVKPFVTPKPKIVVPRPDNIVFRMHYRMTFAICVIASILVSAYAYIDSSGSAIQCLIDKDAPVPQPVINRYCWIQSTYTLPKHYEGVEGDGFLYHGVGPHQEEDEKVYHAYYQWVPLMLFFQGLCFYTPHWIWKQMEGGRMKNIIVGLNNHIVEEDDREKKISELSAYMKERMATSKEHRSWAIKFFICECLNFVNVIIQIILTDVFLDGEFTTYGIEVIRFSNYDAEDRVDPMSRIFPRMTKCMFHKFGGSGTIQRFDALCVLGMNILNEKIYIFLWFWFIILAIVTGVNIVIRLAQFCSPSVRQRFVKLESRGYLGTEVRQSEVESVISRLSYSDWLILYSLSQAMNKRNFGALIAKMNDEIPTRQANDDDDDDDSYTKKDTFKLKNIKNSINKAVA